MTVAVHSLPDDAAARYSETLAGVAAALPSLELAEQRLAPIGGEVWMGSLTLHGSTTASNDVRTSRHVSDRTRAQVFLRDGFLCTYCGGRTIPRCILVAISDVFPEAFPYYAHYRRGTVHPAYWALAPEADHKLAHASGGSSDVDNLTTLHAMCNTRKSSLAAETLPKVNLVSPAAETHWDGLLSRYADIVIAGNHRGRRHSASGYHDQWLRRSDRQADVARVHETLTSD
ncbi:HNH endonuclease [Microbacterium oxydans]|uniref:HNH endonuclease n=1 Tax=Microbacterium oxydans TaxID=82380 RepID=UPI00226B2124|nr:HNH endonuclease signature motif containing protein [Microbacterium oxydans]WAA65596.1 HNH endonuclease [Microbacterium oxydans]